MSAHDLLTDIGACFAALAALCSAVAAVFTVRAHSKVQEIKLVLNGRLDKLLAEREAKPDDV